MNAPLFQLNSLRLGSQALPRLVVESLEIPSGITAIMGKSGAGKTTLLNLLVEFDQPEAGEVQHLCNESPQRLPMSWVPADFGLWPGFTVHDHLVHMAESDRQTDELLELFDLAGCQHQYPETLSMGERARLAVARSLISGAAVHIMDEPFAHVDPARIDRYWEALRRHIAEQKSSLIFATHSPLVVLREAGHLICLDSGRIVWQGKPGDLYYSPPNAELGALLGPINQFSHTDVFPQTEGKQSDCTLVRPEQVELVPNESQDKLNEELKTWSIATSRTVGPYQETVLASTDQKAEKTIYHRIPERKLKAGTQVILKLVTLCVLMAALITQQGCRETTGSEKELKVTEPASFLLPSEEAMLPAARAMTFTPSGELLILDNVGRILHYGADDKFKRKWWMPEHDVGRPEGICVLQDGRYAIADTHYNRVVIFEQDQTVSLMFGENGHGPGQFIYSSAIVQDDEGYLYVSEYGGNDRIQKFTVDGEFVLEFGAVGAGDGEFQRPSGLVWHNEVLYVADAINNRVQSFTRDGKFLKVVADSDSAGLYYPYDIDLGPDDSLYIIEYGAGRMTRISIDGSVLGRYGSEGRGENQFWTPWGIAVNQSGEIAVADTGNRRVVRMRQK